MAYAGLSRARVVAAAAEVADDVGLAQLTLTAVAERCGVTVPSLYKHVDGLDGVRRDLAVLGLTEVAAAMSTAANGASRGDALAMIAHSYRAYARHRPGVFAATGCAPAVDDAEHAAAASAMRAAVHRVVASYGIDGDDAVDATRAVHAAMHGYVTLERHDSFDGARDVDRTFGRLVTVMDNALDTWTPEKGT